MTCRGKTKWDGKYIFMTTTFGQVLMGFKLEYIKSLSTCKCSQGQGQHMQCRNVCANMVCVNGSFVLLLRL